MRSVRAAVGCVGLALVLLLPGGTGQVPADLFLVDVEVMIQPPTVQVRPADVAGLSVIVRNASPSPFPVDVDLSIEPSTDPLEATLDQTSFSLVGGQEATARLTVRAKDEAAGDYAVKVYAYAHPSGQQNPFDTASSSTTVVVETSRFDVFRVAGKGAFIAAGAVLAVGLLMSVFVAVTLARRGFEISTPEAEVRAPPSSRVTFPLQLSNRGRPDLVAFGTGPLPPGWTATFDPPAVDLERGGAATVRLAVVVPRDARGVTQVSVAAHSDARNRTRMLELVVRVQ